MADNREIVGWMYKNGKRIPIRKKKDGETVQDNSGKAAVSPEPEKKEVVFSYGDDTGRRHAQVVDSLPEKKSKFSNGYADVGRHEQDGQTYRIYHDRDGSDQFSYFAIPESKSAAAKSPERLKEIRKNLEAGAKIVGTSPDTALQLAEIDKALKKNQTSRVPKSGYLVDTSVGDLGKFLRETDLDEITLRSSRVSGGWHDNEFAANQAGFSISRDHDDELKKKRQFSEVYRLKRKK